MYVRIFDNVSASFLSKDGSAINQNCDVMLLLFWMFNVDTSCVDDEVLR